MKPKNLVWKQRNEETLEEGGLSHSFSPSSSALKRRKITFWILLILAIACLSIIVYFAGLHIT